MRRPVSPCVFASLFLPGLLAPPAFAQRDGEAPRQRTDRHGDPLPPAALARLGCARFRHTDDVRCVVFAPDGRNLLTASAYFLRRWDAVTGREIALLQPPRRGTAFPRASTRVVTL